MPVTEQLHPALLSFLKNQPKRMLIDGKWVEAASGKTFETVNPATGEVLASAAIRTGYKDLKLITDVEHRLGMDLPLATTVRKYWEAAMDRLGGEADFSRIYEFVKGKRELKTLAARLGKGRRTAGEGGAAA